MYVYVEVTPDGHVVVSQSATLGGKLIAPAIHVNPADEGVIVELTVRGDIVEYRLGSAE